MKDFGCPARLARLAMTDPMVESIETMLKLHKDLPKANMRTPQESLQRRIVEGET